MTPRVAKIDDLFYDSDDGTFKNHTGRTAFTNTDFAKLATTYGARNVDAGSTTLKRAVITSTSLRATAQGQRGRFLGGIIRLVNRDNGLDKALCKHNNFRLDKREFT